MIKALVLALALVCVPVNVAAETISVGQAADHKTLRAAIGASVRGDTIVLQSGEYFAEDLKIPHDLTIEGQGAVVLSARGGVAKGLLVPGPSTIVIIRNITFEGARSPDKNGAGIRFEGTLLTVEQCTFKRNDNAILATGDAQGGLTVRRSLFVNNGHGDGYSHGIYQSKGRRFVVSESVFEGTKVGHHLKTLASEVSVFGNRFDDKAGETSYVVDITAGGQAFIEDNHIIRRRSASQESIFNYDTTRGGKLGVLILRNNKVLTAKRGIRLLRNPEGVPVTQEGNEVLSLDEAQLPAVSVPKPPVPSVVDEPQATTAVAAESAIVEKLKGLSPAQARAVRGLLKRNGNAVSIVGEPTRNDTDLLYSPSFATRQTGDAARFKIRRVGPGHGYVTFGQTFVRGRVPRGAQLTARLGRQSIPVQIDAKAYHKDGSLRHAVITLAVPQGTMNGADGALVVGAGQSYQPQRAERLPTVPDWTVIVTGRLGGDIQNTYEISLRDLVNQRSPVWLSGPLAAERTADIDLGPLLTLRADVRLFEKGVGRVRLSFDNHKTFSSLPRNLQYRVAVKRDDRVIWDEAVTNHYRNSGWAHVLPIGANAAFDIVHDPATLIASGALPPLDLTVPIHRNALLVESESVRLGDHVPINQYFPTTGGRSDIGPLTSWAAVWAITQDPRAKNGMLRVANVGMTIPWHFEEDGTGLPIRADRRPRFWADERGTQDNFAPDQLPTGLMNGPNGGWTLDIAHKPSLAYPAYLATGDLAYLRAIRHEASFGVLAVWPELRGGGTLVTGEFQLRSVAWSLRTISNAAFILPDNDPFKEYFIDVRDSNLKDLEDRYIKRRIMATAGEAEGYFITDSGRDANAISPWQNDFLTITIAQEAIRGSARARVLVEWMTNYTAGRVIASSGHLPSIVGLKQMVIGTDGRRMSSWAAIFEATARLAPEEPYTGGADGGYGILRGALGMIYHATGDFRTVQALQLLRDVPNAEKLTDPVNQLGRNWTPQFSLDSQPVID